MTKTLIILAIIISICSMYLFSPFFVEKKVISPPIIPFEKTFKEDKNLIQETHHKIPQINISTQKKILLKETENMKVQTQNIYESLKPENYESTIEEAKEVFTELDSIVESRETLLAEEFMQIKEYQ